MSDRNGTQRRLIERKLQDLNMEQLKLAAESEHMSRVGTAVGNVLGILCDEPRQEAEILMGLLTRMAVRNRVPLDVLCRQVSQAFDRQRAIHERELGEESAKKGPQLIQAP